MTKQRQQVKYNNVSDLGTIDVENTVLILGNGISRLLFHDFIKNWKGQIWGCNFIYLDFAEELDIITGHYDVMRLAKEERTDNNYKYKIMCKGIAGDFGYRGPVRFSKDSGSTLIAHAMHDGYNVIVAGFDLGGPDIYSHDHSTLNKANWVLRWRGLVETYGFRRIKFLGFNHMPFIRSNENPNEYFIKYNKGESHIDHPDYRKLLELHDDSKHKKYMDTVYAEAKKGYTLKLQNKSKRRYDISSDQKVKPNQIFEVSEFKGLQLLKNYPRDFVQIEKKEEK